MNHIRFIRFKNFPDRLLVVDAVEKGVEIVAER